MKNLQQLSKNIIPSLCSFLLIANALNVFIKSTFPLIANNHDLIANLSSLRFDLKLIIQEAIAYGLFVFGIALLGRARIIWVLCIINLLAILLFSNFFLANMHIHDNLLTIISLVVLLFCYQVFDQQFYIYYSFGLAIAFLIQALFYGTVGSFILRSEFHGIKTIHDALYFCIETYSTVGYGDIYPLTKPAKYFVISMIITGIIIFTAGLTLGGLVVSSKVKKLLFNINKGKISMEHHVVLIGYGITAKILAERYIKDDTQFIVLDSSANMDTEREILKERGKLLISPHTGSNAILERARVNEAQLVIINFERDPDTILSIMNVAEFLKDTPKRPQIIARIYFEENIERAKMVGADVVIAPHVLVADHIEALRQKL